MVLCYVVVAFNDGQYREALLQEGTLRRGPRWVTVKDCAREILCKYNCRDCNVVLVPDDGGTPVAG